MTSPAAYDDLRSVIDSLEPIECDLVTLLAMSRSRADRRLQDVGIQLSWEMGDLPTLDWLGLSEALHILRLLQEPLNNVPTHSHATHVLVATRLVADQIEIRVVDDGVGFDRATSRQGRGIIHLRHRVEVLGGEIDIASHVGGGTTVLVRVPVIQRLPVRSGDKQSDDGFENSDAVTGNTNAP